MKKSKGAVTIFLIIVLFTTVLFGGLFVDATRILLAKRCVQNAMDASARSALSYYDENLSGEYGMFAVDKDTAEDIFRHYFQKNLALSQNDGFNILKMEAKDENISVQASGSILDYSVMLDSMKDYAKYRTVVDTSIGVISKIKGLFGENGAADKAFNAADTGKDAMEQLRADAKELSNSARALISSGMKTQTDAAKQAVKNLLGDKERTTELTDEELGFDKIDQNLTQAEGKSSQIETEKNAYVETNEQESSKLDSAETGTVEYWDEKSQSYQKETGSKENSGEVTDTSNSGGIQDKVDEEKTAVDEQISQVKSKAAEEKTKIREKSNTVVKLNGEIQELEQKVDAAKAAMDASDLENKIKDLEKKQQEAQLALLPQAIEKFEKNNQSASQNETYNALKTAYTDAQTQLEALKQENIPNEDKIAAQEQKVTKAGKVLVDYLENQGTKIETAYDSDLKLAEDALALAKREKETLENTLKAKKNEREKLLEEIQKLYDSIPGSESQAGSIEVPDSVSEEEKSAAETDSKTFISNMVGIFDKVTTELGKDANDVTAQNYSAFEFSITDLLNDVWGTVDKLKDTFNGIKTLVTDPSQAENAALFTDYIFNNCTFLTSQTERPNRHFQAGEIEYILNGDPSQVKCITATVTDIALLRLTINWVDYMATTHSPEIISRAVIALGRAGIRTVKDMADMIFTTDDSKSASCPLSPSFTNVKLTYSDHLRLSMMIRALGEEGRNTMMNRFQTMLKDTYQVQDWDGPYEEMTRIQADVTVDVDLIMLTLPIFENVLPEDNQILQDGKFLVHESISMGY